MKLSQISLGSLFWIVTLVGAIIACYFGELVIALPLGAIAGFVLADRLRKKRESDPNYIPPTAEQVVAQQKSQLIGCLIFAVIVILAIWLLLTQLVKFP